MFFLFIIHSFIQISQKERKANDVPCQLADRWKQSSHRERLDLLFGTLKLSKRWTHKHAIAIRGEVHLKSMRSQKSDVGYVVLRTESELMHAT